ALMRQYRARHDDRSPQVPPFPPPGEGADERMLQRAAEQNNRGFLRALRQEGLLGEESFGGLPSSIYNDSMIRDAWGSPIVFMPAMHEGIGMAPQNQPFFFSAGADREYLTQEN